MHIVCDVNVACDRFWPFNSAYFDCTAYYSEYEMTFIQMNKKPFKFFSFLSENSTNAHVCGVHFVFPFYALFAMAFMIKIQMTLITKSNYSESGLNIHLK